MVYRIAPFFLILFSSGTLLAQVPHATITAQEVVNRIKSQIGLEWATKTVDDFKTGDPDTKVTGIAVTMMSTLDVLQRAAAKGYNFVITHEPTFYGHWDDTLALAEADDPVYAAKSKFIRDHDLIIWRFHDHWHRRDPDGIRVGMIKALGWEGEQDPDDPAVFELPETSLRDLASEIKDRLGIRTLRVVGDPNLRVSRAGLSPGFAGFTAHRTLLARDDLDVLVFGEAHEWETVSYANDAIAAGMKKALIVLGHIPSEQAGMAECTEWLKGFVTEVPIELVEAKEPFWAP